MLRNGARAIVLKKAVLGVASGLAIGLIANGYVSVGPVIGPVIHGVAGVSDATYRVSLFCPVRNHRVSFRVRAENAGGAHMALEWVMPGCDLTAVSNRGPARDGKSWFSGEFRCQGNHYKRAVTVRAVGLRDAGRDAVAMSPDCEVRSIDQLACSVFDPLCRYESEDFTAELDLAKTRLLR